MRSPALEPADRFETPGGVRPQARPLDDALARKHPIAAFAILEGGDAFETIGGKPPRDGRATAESCLRTRVRIDSHGAPSADVAYVQGEMARTLGANPALALRLQLARPIEVQLIPPGRKLSSFGFPPTSASAIGLFWDDPAWPAARMALRRECLREEPQLVVHELAHALHHMAFTATERTLIRRVLGRTWRSEALVDEVFAIFSERELVEAFTEHDYRAPGVYGLARRRWSEDQLFTRFVRHLYFPHKPLAGPPLGIL